MLKRLARVMRPGAEMRFATDIDDNAGWTLARVLRSPDFSWRAQSAQDWRDPWSGWAARAMRPRRSRRDAPVYLAFVRVAINHTLYTGQSAANPRHAP